MGRVVSSALPVGLRDDAVPTHDSQARSRLISVSRYAMAGDGRIDDRPRKMSIGSLF